MQGVFALRIQGIKPGRIKPSLEDKIDYLNIAKVEYIIRIYITVTAFTNKRLFGLILLSSILDLSLTILYRQTGVREDVQLVAKHLAVKTE